MLDEDADGLPLGSDDLKWGPILRFIRSPFLHSALGHAHSVSCVGFEAAAAEAAAYGPQLCVILSLADAPGHAYWWQNIVYTMASMAFVAAVVASARSPSKAANVPLPPEKAETLVCLALDAMTALCIVLSYPHLNTWLLRIAVVAVIGCAVAAQHSPVREIYLDWLEPIFVIRSDSHKRLHNGQRQLLRQVAWGAAWTPDPSNMLLGTHPKHKSYLRWTLYLTRIEDIITHQG
ncbi:unnamed protein product [Symbiodinium pilosum]|uniref:Uncharacterized protein n=1 Tax=Symbiodinium pilosum TaxID=2952 RepID=A0A812MF93_SYMPI|nr:unnamed protein product [Symbiodinium pilosum]